MSNMMSGGEKCYRETQHAQGAGVCVCVGGMEGGGKQVPLLKPFPNPRAVPSLLPDLGFSQDTGCLQGGRANWRNAS